MFILVVAILASTVAQEPDNKNVTVRKVDYTVTGQFVEHSIPSFNSFDVERSNPMHVAALVHTNADNFTVAKVHLELLVIFIIVGIRTRCRDDSEVRLRSEIKLEILLEHFSDTNFRRARMKYLDLG